MVDRRIKYVAPSVSAELGTPSLELVQRLLDQIPRLRVLNRLDTPPGGEVAGDAYLVIATASVDFAGWEDYIALFTGGDGYSFIEPREGLEVWSEADSAVYRYSGAAWAAVTGGGGGGDALTSGTLDQFADVTQTAGKTLAITDNTTLGGGSHSGTNTGDQTISLTGDVTGSGTGSFAASIATSAITGRTNDASPDGAADYFLSYDASATALKKVLGKNIVDKCATAALVTGQGTQATPDGTNDFVLTYDSATTGLKKVRLYVVANTATAWQPVDAELTAIAGLTSAADSAPYFTGSGTASLFTITAFGRSLVDDADATAARTTLGLAIGTNVQAWDADLDAIAALTSAADKLPYATGAGTWSLTSFTAAGRALVDDADTAAQRTTLGLGDIATKSTASVIGLALAAYSNL